MRSVGSRPRCSARRGPCAEDSSEQQQQLAQQEIAPVHRGRNGGARRGRALGRVAGAATAAHCLAVPERSGIRHGAGDVERATEGAARLACAGSALERATDRVARLARRRMARLQALRRTARGLAWSRLAAPAAAGVLALQLDPLAVAREPPFAVQSNANASATVRVVRRPPCSMSSAVKRRLPSSVKMFASALSSFVP